MSKNVLENQENQSNKFSNEFSLDIYSAMMKKKNLVWHSHNLLLPYITVGKYFIIGITFIFNFYFLGFVADG